MIRIDRHTGKRAALATATALSRQTVAMATHSVPESAIIMQQHNQSRSTHRKRSKVAKKAAHNMAKNDATTQPAAGQSTAAQVSQAPVSTLSTKLEKYRLPLSKLFVALVLLLMVFTTSLWQLSATATWAVDSIALVLLLVACLGRVWCIMYIGGQKNTSVVTAGPYSMVRNPLYVFSFVGALGIVLMTHSIVIAALLLIFFVGIYPFVVTKEEANLLGYFGEDYQAYCDRTPRFIPSLKLYSTETRVEADIKRMEKSLFDSGAFVLAFIALSAIRVAHETGFIPVLFKLP